MKRVIGIIALSLATTMLVSTQAEAQRGGFGGRGGRGGFDRGQMEQMRARAETMQRADVAWLWTVMSFNMDLAEGQMASMKNVLKSTWDTKQTYISEALERDADWKAMAEEMEELEKLMDKQIENILSEDQRRQLKDIKKLRRKMMESMRPGR